MFFVLQVGEEQTRSTFIWMLVLFNNSEAFASFPKRKHQETIFLAENSRNVYNYDRIKAFFEFIVLLMAK